MARYPIVYYKLPRRPTMLTLERLPNGGYVVTENPGRSEPYLASAQLAAFTELSEACNWIMEQMLPRPGDGAPINSEKITEGPTDGR